MGESGKGVTDWLTELCQDWAALAAGREPPRTSTPDGRHPERHADV